MKKVLAIAISMFLLIALGLVFFGPIQAACYPAQALGHVDVPTDPMPVSNPSAPVTVRVATWNTYLGNSTGRVVAGLEALTRVSDVIGAQELFSADRRAVVGRALARKGWAASSGADSAVPIFYNAAKYKLLAHDVVKEFDVTRIENGPSGTSIGPRWIQWVQLEDRATGGVFFVVNHHIIPGVASNGRPRTSAPERLAIRDKQVAMANSIITKLRSYGPVVLTEDSNVDNRADQRVKDPRLDYVQMQQMRMATNWTMLGMPRTGSLLDKIAVTLENTRFTGQTRLPTWGSDHHPIVATITKTSSSAPAAASSAAVQATLPTSLTVPGLSLDADQINVAAAAIQVGKQYGVPERGWIVAIATALQESGLQNLDHGDRDSLGAWQQRPSTGWGTPAQIRDLTLAVRAFYGVADHTHNPGLLDIHGWAQMSIAQAAQAVQRSAFPSAYAKWETPATTIVAKLAALAGTSSGTGDCGTHSTGLSGDCPPTNMPAEKVLSPDAMLVLRCVAAQFPQITTIGTYPGHLPDESRAVDIMIPGWNTDAGKALGDQIAAWVRAHQAQLGVQYVIWSARIWNIERNDEGWRRYASITGHDDPSSLHYNHVHVSVYGNRGTGPDGSDAAVGTGDWHLPVGQPFRVGCGFGCYAGHTGQDFPAPAGTPVYAVTDGTVIRSESITTTGICTTLPICGGTRISYGNLIVIRLASGGDITAWYAHLSERRVRVGQVVRAGQIIGTVGYQGHVIPAGPRGAHLHFEIRRGGTPVDPLPYLRGKGINP
ncbi:peptidoglycan DD-metalloendopeptidase family protein [Microlunatus ginsengisoli]|uniref:Peptidoglycan DD-metalloendopeptidase family protein n=1 Tax=Microlunatus ginsengisoli TaxID=363863 RepID=A0ABP7ABR6_9ACTN